MQANHNFGYNKYAESYIPDGWWILWSHIKLQKLIILFCYLQAKF